MEKYSNKHEHLLCSILPEDGKNWISLPEEYEYLAHVIYNDSLFVAALATNSISFFQINKNKANNLYEKSIPADTAREQPSLTYSGEKLVFFFSNVKTAEYHVYRKRRVAITTIFVVVIVAAMFFIPKIRRKLCQMHGKTNRRACSSHGGLKIK